LCLECSEKEMVYIKVYRFYTCIIIALALYLQVNSSVAQKSYLPLIDSLKSIAEQDISGDSLASVYSKIGGAYYESDSLVQAIIFKKKAAAIYLENNRPEKYSKNLEDIGVYYSFMNDYRQSLKYFLDALAVLDKQNNKTFNYFTLIQNIGISYVEADDIQKGISFLNTAMGFFEKDTTSENKEYLIVNYVDLGTAYSLLDITDSAFIYFSKALSAAKKHNITKYSGGVLVNLGDLYVKLKVYDKAKSYYEEARSEFKKNHDDRGYWHTIYGLAVNEKLQGNIHYAISLLDSASNYFKESNDLGYLSDSYSQLSQIYEDQNDINNALKYFKLCSAVKDSIAASDEKNKMTELQMEYELQKTEIENNNQISLFQKESQLRMYKVYIIIGILIIALLAVGIYIVRLRSKKRLTESRLENAKLEQQQMTTHLEFKQKEMENLALYIMQKNEFLEQIKQGLGELRKTHDESNVSKIKNLSFKITQSLRKNKDMEKLSERIDQLHASFLKLLGERYPDLTEKEKRLCVLLKLNFSSKEISVLNNISENAVMMARYRMRKKMGINTEKNLTEFLQKFS